MIGTYLQSKKKKTVITINREVFLMNSMTKKMQKDISKISFLFPTNMYSNAYGSVVVSAYILSENKEKYDLKEIGKKWRKIEKNPNKYIKFGLSDEKFIDKCLNLFGIERPKDFPIAMVLSNLNVLFVPYVNGELYPIREDGFIPYTYKEGKVYPITFPKENE